MNMSRGTNTKKVLIGPRGRENLSILGENIKLARLRRQLTVEMISERAGISRTTVWKIEKGDPSVAIGLYVKVLNALQLMDDIRKVAYEDSFGHRIQDADLLRHR